MHVWGGGPGSLAGPRPMTRPEIRIGMRVSDNTPSWLAPWLAASPRTIREMATATRREAEALNAVADALEAELRRRGWSVVE